MIRRVFWRFCVQAWGRSRTKSPMFLSTVGRVSSPEGHEHRHLPGLMTSDPTSPANRCHNTVPIPCYSLTVLWNLTLGKRMSLKSVFCFLHPGRKRYRWKKDGSVCSVFRLSPHHRENEGRSSQSSLLAAQALRIRLPAPVAPGLNAVPLHLNTPMFHVAILQSHTTNHSNRKPVCQPSWFLPKVIC